MNQKARLDKYQDIKDLKNLQSLVENAMNSKDARNHELDYEQLKELHSILDTKGDKSEVMQKVDKADLTKAQRLLHRRIENL